MNTLTSALPLDVSGLSGLSVSFGDMFRGLTALLPDLALKGGLLLLIALVVDAVLRRASAATRHAHWQLALGGALALVLLLPLLPRVPVELPLPAALAQAGTWFGAAAAPSTTTPGQFATQTSVKEPTAARKLLPAGASVTAPQQAAAHFLPRVDAPPAARMPLHQHSDALAGQQVPCEHHATPAALEPQASGHESTLLSAGSLTPSRPGTSAGTWLTLMWALGAAFVLTLLCVSLLRARSMARAAKPVLDPAWLALLARTSGELSLKRRVTLLVADGPVVPMTWGHSHPVILLPADANDWSAPRRRQVLLHELAHIQRGDWLSQILAQVACALYWYQPLAWLAARRLRQQREHACDDRVLAAGNRASDYAGHLLDIARTRQVGLTGSFATLAMARRSQLEGRLLAVLDERRDRRVLPGRSTLAAAAVAGSLVLALACVQPKPEEASTASPPAPVLQQLNQRGFGRPTPSADKSCELASVDEVEVNEEQAIAPMVVVTAQNGTVLKAREITMNGVRISSESRQDAARADIAPRATSPGNARTVQPAWALRALVTRGTRADVAPLAALAAGPLTQDAIAPLADLGPASADDPFADAADWEDGLEWPDCAEWCEDQSNSWNWSDGGDEFHVTLRDWIEPNEAGTKLAFVGDGAQLIIERTHAGTTDRIEVTGGGEDENGVSLWKFAGTLGGATAEAPALQAEFDRLLPGVLAHTGMFAEQRVNWLLDHGGISAVLSELGALPDESTRMRFHEVLLTEHELDTADAAAALAQLRHDLPSDAFLATLLEEAGPDLLADPDLVAPLFGAVDSLESDAYQAQVLESLMNGEYLDGPVLVAVLTSVTNGMESDSYATAVLVEVPGARLRDPGVRQAFLTALGTVDSNAYLAEVITELLDQRGVKGETLAALIDAAATSVSSDSYLAQILQELPARALSDNAVRAAALAALGSIDSDAYLAQTLIEFLDADDLPRTALDELLDAAARGIDGDAAMAEVLADVPPEALADAGLRARFDAALATIESPSYRAAVLEELDLAPKDS